MKTQHRASEFTLSRDEVGRILNAAGSLRDRTLIELLYFCALRVSEAANLDVRDVDLERRRLTIVGKGEKKRVVPVPEKVSQDLRFVIDGRSAGPVFTSRKPGKSGRAEAVTARQAQRILAAAAERAGVSSPNPDHPNVNPHLLRHSAARHILAAGKAPRIVQHFLGHSSIRTTLDVYGTPSEEEVAGDVLDSWGET